MSLPKWIVAGLLLTQLVACSSNEEEGTQGDENQVELSEADAELDGSEVVLDEDLMEDSKTDTATTEGADDSMVVMNEDGQEKVHQSDAPPMNHPVQMDNTKGMASYKVQKGDTLMWISFKIYGDYTKWRHLAHSNPNVVKNGFSVAPGTSLNYVPPVEEFDWSPTGNPYLVKKGDTLGTISKDVYGVEKRWNEIFEHNRPLIRDPNLIFAGFTVYYMPDAGKKLASEAPMPAKVEPAKVIKK